MADQDRSLQSDRSHKLAHVGASLALAALGVVFGLLVAELVSRLVGISYPSLYTPDPYCGDALRPGASGWWNTEGHSFVSINSDGLRDRDHIFAKPPNTLRVAVLGDSYAEALQVPAHDAFWAVMERKLAACPVLANKQVEAINFGVSGYGTARELMMLRHRVWKYSPDVVVLAVTIGNDIRNNSRRLEQDPMRPYFVLSQDGKLLLDDSFLRSSEYRRRLTLLHRLLEKLIPYSRVMQVLNQIVNVSRERRAESLLPPGSELGVDEISFRKPTDPVQANAWNVTDRLIETMNDEVKEHGAMFLVVTLTTGIQVNPTAAVRKPFLERLGVTDLFYPDRRIKALGQRDGFDVLNLGEPFLAYAERNHIYFHGFQNTTMGRGHWNENGHQLAGEMIAEQLCQMLDRPVGSGRAQPSVLINSGQPPVTPLLSWVAGVSPR